MLNVKRQQGFTLIELVVVVAIIGLLAALATPGFKKMIGNSQVRTLADSLQNGLRLAQAEATRRYRTVILFRSNSPACELSNRSASSGGFWVLRTVPIADETAEMIQCGSFGELGAGGGTPNVWMSGATAVCFSADGRLQALGSTLTGVDVACTVDASGSTRFNIEGGASDRKLQVRVSTAGSVRMCDPNKAADTPEGCPA